MNQPGHILVVIDPKQDEDPAFGRAKELAKATGAALQLAVCDYVEGLSRTVFASEKEVREARDEYVSAQAERLEELAERMQQDGIEATTRVAWQRPRYEAVLEAAQNVDADLVVKTASGRSLAERLLLGATDWELIRRCPRPLWLVKSSQSVSNTDWIVAIDPAHPDEKHVGLDEKLLEIGKRYADALDSKLHVFHAFAPPAMVAPTGGAGAAVPTISTLPMDTDAILDERKKRIRDMVAPFDIPESRLDVAVGDTVLQLEQLVDKRKASVVVAGAVSRGMLERMLLGNTAESILDNIDSDMLIVKPDGFGEAR